MSLTYQSHVHFNISNSFGLVNIFLSYNLNSQWSHLWKISSFIGLIVILILLYDNFLLYVKNWCNYHRMFIQPLQMFSFSSFYYILPKQSSPHVVIFLLLVEVINMNILGSLLWYYGLSSFINLFSTILFVWTMIYPSIPQWFYVIVPKSWPYPVAFDKLGISLVTITLDDHVLTFISKMY